MSLIGWWPLNKNYSNQGALLTQDITTATLEANGKLGKFAYFNKTKYNGEIDLLTHWNPQQVEMSMCCWVKFNYDDYKTIAANTTFSSSQTALTGCIIGSTSYGGTGIIWNSNTIMSNGTKGELTQIKAQAYMRGESSTMTCGATEIPNNTWTHLAYVTNPISKMAYFYVNGVLKGSKTFSNLPALSGSRTFGINRNDVYGGNGPGISGPLSICDVRLYDHSLTPGEVREISNGLLVHYDFNYLETGLNLISEPNNWSNKYTKPDGSGQSAIGTATEQSDDSLKIVDNATNTRLRYSTNLDAKKGDSFLVSIKYKLESGDQTFRWQIQELNSAGSVVNTHWSHTTQGYSDIGNKWNIIYFMCNVTHADTAKLRFWLQDGADYTTYTHTYYIKDFSVQKIENDYVIDSSGYGYDAKVYNSCHFIKDSERGIYAYQTEQTANGGAQADASYLLADIGANLTPTAFTISMWMKLNAWGKQTSGILQLGTGTAGTDYTGCTLSQRDSYFDLNVAGASTQYRLSSTFIPTGTWHHVAITWDGANAYGYLDGVQKATKEAPLGTSDPFRYIFLGLDRAGGATRDADIVWGEFKLYMTALTAEEILDLAKTKTYIFETGEIMTHNFIEHNESTMVTKKGTLETKGLYEELNAAYEQLEYIQSTGTQYIDTGHILATENHAIELDMAWTGTSVSTFESFAGFMASSTTPRTGLHKYSSVLMFGANATTSSTVAPVSKERMVYKCHCISGNQTLYKNDMQIASNKTTFDYSANTQSLYIFARNASGKNLSSMQLYSGKIYENNTLLYHYIPVRRVSDKALGLYDIINEKFYSNAGTGTFTAGPAVTNNCAAFYESGMASGRHLIEV